MRHQIGEQVALAVVQFQSLLPSLQDERRAICVGRGVDLLESRLEHLLVDEHIPRSIDITVLRFPYDGIDVSTEKWPQRRFHSPILIAGKIAFVSTNTLFCGIEINSQTERRVPTA